MDLLLQPDLLIGYVQLLLLLKMHGLFLFSFSGMYVFTTVAFFALLFQSFSFLFPVGLTYMNS